MLFPDINTLFTVNLDGDFRAHNGTKCTAGAFFSLISAYGMVAAGIIFFRRYDATLLTGINAKMTFLAKFFVDYNITFQNKSSKMV
jgi:hypothetical protein